MVKVNSRPPVKNFSDFLQLIEQEVKGFPVDLVHVAEECGCPRALLVLDRNLAPTRKEVLARAVVGSRPTPETREEQQSASPLRAAENFLCCVQRELARVKKTRLPCALLLIRIAGKDGSLANQAARNLTTEIAGDHHLAPLDHTTLALLLPGLNRTRALAQASAIHQLLAAETLARVTIGLTVCLARAVPAAQEFMDMALHELQKAEQETGDIFYSCHQQDDDSCQVTAEERAHLFSFLNRGQKE